MKIDKSKKLIKEHRDFLIQKVGRINNVRVYEIETLEGFEKFLIKIKTDIAYVFNINKKGGIK